MAQEEVVIVPTVPITGNFAATGINYYNSLRMAQDDINAAGGINGKKIRIVFEDTGPTNSTAVNALVKLVRQTKPPLIFLNSLSVQILAQEQEIQKAGVPVLYSGALVALHEKGNPMMFRIRRRTTCRPRSSRAASPRSPSRRSRPSSTCRTSMAPAPPSSWRRSSRNSACPSWQGELLAARQRLLGAAPQHQERRRRRRGLRHYNRDGALIVKQRRSLGLDIPFLCTTAMFSSTTLDLVEPDDLKGVYAAGDVVLETNNDKSKEFVKRYTERWGFRPDPYGAAYYDAMYMVVDAIKKNGTDPAKLQAYFANLEPWQGTAQLYVNQKNGTNNLAHGTVLVKFKPGTKDFEPVLSNMAK